MGEQLDDMRHKVDAQAKRHQEQEASIQDVLRRLEALERDGGANHPAVWRRPLMAEDDDREPAVIIGGWKDDTDADFTLKAVQDFIRDRALPLPAHEAFVPGQRRGFAVVPVVPVDRETRQP